MALRKSLAVFLSAVMLTLGAPLVGLAQTQGSTLRGQVVDAGGRGSSGLPVELVSERLVVATTLSGPDGHFSFSGVPANNYVVRTTVNGQPSGVRVSVVPGQPAQHALIVLPSVATASPAVIAVIGVNGLVTTLTVAAGIAVSEITVEANKNGDIEKIADTRQAAANFIVAQLASAGVPATQIAQIVNVVSGNSPPNTNTPANPVAPIVIALPGGGTVTITPASGTQ